MGGLKTIEWGCFKKQWEPKTVQDNIDSPQQKGPYKELKNNPKQQ